MLIYREDNRAKLYYPSTESFPVSTEIKISNVSRNQDWSWVQLNINGAVFFKKQVHRHDKEKIISKLQNTVNDIIDIIINGCQVNNRIVKSIRINNDGRYEIFQ